MILAQIFVQTAFLAAGTFQTGGNYILGIFEYIMLILSIFNVGMAFIEGMVRHNHAGVFHSLAYAAGCSAAFTIVVALYGLYGFTPTPSPTPVQ